MYFFSFMPYFLLRDLRWMIFYFCRVPLIKYQAQHRPDMKCTLFIKKKDCESAVSWYQRLCIEIHVFSRVCRSVCSRGESSCDHCLYLDLASVPDPSPDRDLLVPTPAPRHVQTCSLNIQRSPLDMLKLVHLDLTIQGIPPPPPPPPTHTHKARLESGQVGIRL